MPWKPDYASLSEGKNFARIYDNEDDAELVTMLGTASRNVDQHTGRQFGRVDAPVRRVYPIRYSRSLCSYWAIIDDLMTTDDLVIDIDGAAVDLADVTLTPENAAADDKPWEAILLPRYGRKLGMVARWGWTTIQASVKEATLLEFNRLVSRRTAPFGISGSPQQGGELRLLDKIDVDAAKALKGYRRMWVAK